MAKFTVRMVLHDADWDDYISLASEMAERGFVDTIVGASGNTYTLPDAEYYGSAADIEAAMNHAKAAAGAVGKKYAVFITQSAATKWVGLEKA